MLIYWIYNMQTIPDHSKPLKNLNRSQMDGKWMPNGLSRPLATEGIAVSLGL